jgi:ABC-type glycerol-3-phosphate transport system substrate-binding protein
MQHTVRHGGRKPAVTALLLATSVLLVSACSSPAPEEPTSTDGYDEYESILTDSASGQSITFWGWDPLDFNKPIEDYVKAVAGVTTTGRQIPVAEIINQLQLSAQAGGLPDVFKGPSTTQLPGLVEAGVVMDITDLVEPYREFLSDVAWESCTHGGKIYCLPANSPAGGVFYRADVLEEFGIDPTSLTTWDKYIAAAQKLSEDSDGEHHLFGFTDTPPGALSLAIANQNHAVLIDSDLKVQVSPDSQEWQDSMELLRDLMSTPGVGKEYPEWTPEWFEAIKTGSLSSYILGTWFVQTIIQQAPDSEGAWTFTPLPATEEGGDRYPYFGSAFVAVSSQTDKQDAAFELAKAWSIDPEGSLAIGLQQLGISTVNKVALESDFANEPNPYFANEQAYWKDATDAYANITFLPPASTASDQAATIFTTNLTEFINGQSTDDFLTKLAADLRQQIKGAK